jgi:type IV secretion system protein VirB5
MALGGMLLSTGLSAGLLWQSMQNRVVPYVVEVDRLGEARAVAPVGAGYRPTDPQIAWHLGRFVMNVRSVSLDPVLMRHNWLSAYDFVTDRGARFLNDYARSAQPFARVGNRTVSVQVTSVVRASDRSFQVQWIETGYEHGNLADTSRWTGIFSVDVKPPASADDLQKNPLGLRIDGIDWSRELDSSEPVRAAAAAPLSERPLPLGSALDSNVSRPAPPLPASERNSL